MQQHDLMAIGGRLHYIRKKHNYTFPSLAEKAGLHFNTISRAEKGKIAPPQTLLDYLNKAHGYNADWILFNKGRETGKVSDKDSKASMQAKIYELERELTEVKHILKTILEKIESLPS